jgi:predicted acetyltransferase
MVTLALTQTRENGNREYNILADNKEVGFCQLRLIPSKSSEMPKSFENHIYYEVNPEQRGQGYATQALALLLAEAKKSNLQEVILVVATANIASQKVVLKNGGKVIAVTKGMSGAEYQKYSINLC